MSICTNLCVKCTAYISFYICICVLLSFCAYLCDKCKAYISFYICLGVFALAYRCNKCISVWLYYLLIACRLSLCVFQTFNLILHWIILFLSFPFISSVCAFVCGPTPSILSPTISLSHFASSKTAPTMTSITASTMVTLIPALTFLTLMLFKLAAPFHQPKYFYPWDHQGKRS